MMDSLSADELRSIIEAVGAKYPLAGSFMRTLVSKTVQKRAAGQELGSKKRKADPVIAICGNCSEPFCPDDPSDSKKGECVYHPGELEVYDDEDFWADHDENTHGPCDTDENKEQYPEGFAWDCCERRSDMKGCKRGRHCIVGEEASSNEESDDDTGPDEESDQPAGRTMNLIVNALLN